MTQGLTDNVFCTDVTFDNCEISSKSGRGVVAIRGALLSMANSTVSKSAATGIYIGGDGTTGEMSDCTVTDCGRGGQRVSRALGHNPRYSNPRHSVQFFLLFLTLGLLSGAPRAQRCFH